MSNDVEALCSACGWSVKRQNCCSYNSHVKLFYGVGNRGVWSIGFNLIIKERTNDPPTFEVPNAIFLQTHTTIPVPNIIEEWAENDGSYFVVMKRIPGTNSREAWPELSESGKHRIAQQVVECLGQLRELHSETLGGLDGKPLYSAFLFLNGNGLPHGPLNSDAQLWQEMAKGLKKKGLPKNICNRFGRRMPPSAPYTFTHGDLTDINIMVKDGNLAGIVDWEYGGYFPVWWEFASTRINHSPEDKEWKEILRQHMDNHAQGHDFWVDYYKLSWYPNLDERGKALFQELESEGD